jgi:hypothetical protein
MKKTISKTQQTLYLDSEAVWEYIETGKDVDTLYPEEFDLDKNLQEYIKSAEEMLLPGELLYCYDGNTIMFLNYGITSFGRMFNLKHKRPLIPYCSMGQSYFAYSIRNNIVKTNVEFNKLGWNHDVNEIIKHFDNNNWKVTHIR